MVQSSKLIGAAGACAARAIRALTQLERLSAEVLVQAPMAEATHSHARPHEKYLHWAQEE